MYEKLIEKMERLNCYNPHMIKRVKHLIDELNKNGVLCIERFVSRLSRNVHDRNEYLDILREGRFAFMLASNHFEDIHLEFREEGPDIRAVYQGHIVYFEITRKRPNQEDEHAQCEIGFIETKSAASVINKICGELEQLESDEINVIVLWSDTISLGLEEFDQALEHVQREIDQNPTKYKDLSGVLFVESGETSNPNIFRLFSNDKALKPLEARLTDKLNKLSSVDI